MGCPDCHGQGDIATTVGTGLGIGAVLWFGLLTGGVYLAYRLVTSDFGKDVAKSAILTRVGKR